jgi:hypothetical protein
MQCGARPRRAFDAGSELVSADAAAWLAGPPPSRSMRVLAVPSEAAAIVNGALPAAFESGRGDIWVLEFIFKVGKRCLRARGGSSLLGPGWQRPAGARRRQARASPPAPRLPLGAAVRPRSPRVHHAAAGSGMHGSQDPASDERRWASMNWYEDGILVVSPPSV